MNSFLSRYQPAGVLNILGGISAAFLIHAEIYGIPAACFTLVVDSHYITAENLQGFTPIIHDLLGLKTINMADIHRHTKFKEVLKEANTRGNNIFN